METDISGAVLSIEGLEIHANLGYYEEERTVRQKFLIDLHLQFKSKPQFRVSLEDSVDYKKVISLVRTIMADPGDLIEHTAHRLGQEILKAFAPLSGVRVRIRKRPQVRAVMESVSYECTLHAV